MRFDGRYGSEPMYMVYIYIYILAQLLNFVVEARGKSFTTIPNWSNDVLAAI